MNQIRYIDPLERILITLWVGGLWVVGYLTSPVLFSQLPDRKLAGDIAGTLFQIIHTIGLASAIVLLMMAYDNYRAFWWRIWRVWLLIAMAALTAVLLFYVQPLIHELKSVPLLPGSEAARQFGAWHGISASIYLILSLLGLILAGAGVRGQRAV